MVAPTFKKATTTTAGDPSRYGAPDIKYAFDVLDGTHATDRIQIKNIENKELLTHFDWLIYHSAGTPLQADYRISVLNLKTGVIELVTTELRFATLHVFSSITHTPPAESTPVLRIALQGTLDCITRGNYIIRSCVIDGLGTAVIRRAAHYANDSAVIFIITNSNVTIKNVTFQDIIMNVSQNNAEWSNAITCDPATPGVENVIIENVKMIDFVQHALSFSATFPRYMKNLRFWNMRLDTTYGGSIATVRLGSTHVLLENNVHIDSDHTSQDLSGPNPHCVVINNYHKKNRGNGGMIAAVSVAEREDDWGECEENTIRDNYLYSDYFNIAETETVGGSTQSGVRVHGDARKIAVAQNFISGMGENGVTVKSFNVFRVEEGETADPFAAYSDEVIITNNIIWRTYGPGVLGTLTPASATDPKEQAQAKPYTAFSVIGNEIEPRKGTHGININSDGKFCLMTNNLIYHVNDRNVDNGCGIQMRINCQDNLVMGNHIMQPSANLANFDHNIYQDSQGSISPSDRTYILDNQLQSGKPVTLLGSNNFINGNVGYKTEAWGTATVATDDTTSSAITHGLDYTPTAKDITIRPAGDTGNATQYRATSIGASTFVITVNATPGVTTATFAWKIKRN